jgi:hypothetical protein
MKPLFLDDLHVFARTSAKMTKALAVIAAHLHQTYALQPWTRHADVSKESCILASLTVRDFLHKVGFKDAEVRPVSCYMQAQENRELLHSLCIGHPSDTPKEGRWIGHMVVVVPSEDILIDTTLYPTKRPQWNHLPGMICANYDTNARDTFHGKKPIGGLSYGGGTEDEYTFDLMWLDAPANQDWRGGGDAKEKWRRRDVVKAMVNAFGKWRDK